jgi:hypothetical protein
VTTEKSWRDYPPSMITLLERFAKGEEVKVPFMRKKEAQMCRREYYRLRQTLKHAADHFDEEAMELHAAIDRMTITIEPHGGVQGEPAVMSLISNPILEALEAAVGETGS